MTKIDRRRFNGGNSTKAKDGKLDKRKNEYRTALADALTPNEIIDVIQAMQLKAIKGDVQAAKVILEYYLGKPKESVDITTNGEEINVPTIIFKRPNE